MTFQNFVQAELDDSSSTSFTDYAKKSTSPALQSSSSIQPDGGLVAWLQVLGAWILYFNTWGAMNTFGVFQTYYESGELFRESSSNIAWIGSIQSFCLQATGLIAGPIYDRGGFKGLIVVGSFGVVSGYLMLSLCEKYWQVVLAQGFLIGIGQGCLFTPMVSILPKYFSARLGLAMGVASSGSSIGGIVYPVAMKSLIGKIGFAWTMRVLGFIAAGMLLIPVFVMREQAKPAVRKHRPLIDVSAFTDVPFMIFILATLIGFIGLTIALFYLSLFALAQNITDENLAFYIVPIYNAASVFGRVVPNAISDKTGPLNIIAPCAVLTGVLFFCLIPVCAGQASVLVVLTVLLGFFSGVFVAIPGTIFPRLTKDKSMLGTRVGMGFAMIGFGMLVGGPGAGKILVASLGAMETLNFKALWTFAGVTATVSGFFYSVVRFLLTGPKYIVKA